MDKAYSEMKKWMFILLILMSMMNDVTAQNADYLFMIENATKAPSGHNTQTDSLNQKGYSLYQNI